MLFSSIYFPFILTDNGSNISNINFSPMENAQIRNNKNKYKEKASNNTLLVGMTRKRILVLSKMVGHKAYISGFLNQHQIPWLEYG